MNLLIISDIHGNWPALRAVLEAEPDVDRTLCLGDLVGYGPQPFECVAWAKGILPPEWIIQGNHDLAIGANADPRCPAAYAPLAYSPSIFPGQPAAPAPPAARACASLQDQPVQIAGSSK
jgi:hypothetical protein